jgi:hypothetical protein
MIKNKWRHRFSYHEWLMLYLVVAPVIVIAGVLGYLIGSAIVRLGIL